MPGKFADSQYVFLANSHPGVQVGMLEKLPKRKLAVADMVERARQLGSNAVVGLRFDHRTVANQWTEICAYGTAMVLSQRRSA